LLELTTSKYAACGEYAQRLQAGVEGRGNTVGLEKRAHDCRRSQCTDVEHVQPFGRMCIDQQPSVLCVRVGARLTGRGASTHHFIRVVEEPGEEDRRSVN
jgi:hypothetical protein